MTAGTRSGDADSTFAVATYNGHGCVGRDGACDARRIADVVCELDASLVGIQEIHSSEDAEADYAQLARVA